MESCAQYDDISSAYHAMVASDPCKQFVQFPWAIAHLPQPVSRRRILDVGCGDGALACLIAQMGARVIAYDESAELIRAARNSQGAGTADIEFLIARPESVTAMVGHGTIDHAVSTCVLHYAPDREYLSVFFRSTAMLLRPGAIFAALVMNPEYSRFGEIAYNRRYERAAPGRIRVEFHDAGACLCSADYSDFTKTDYGDAASSSDWMPLTWVPVVVAEAGKAKLGAFWDGFESDCPYAGFVAVRR